jgi:hypothetical protein
MFDAIAGAAAALKQISDTIKSVKGLVQGEKDSLSGGITDAYARLFAAQTQMFAALEKVRHLESELEKYRKACRQMSRYQLVKFAGGAFAYAPKPGKQGAEPLHYLCTECVRDGEKSILQGMESATYGHRLTCPRCKLEIAGPGE